MQLGKILLIHSFAIHFVQTGIMDHLNSQFLQDPL